MENEATYQEYVEQHKEDSFAFIKNIKTAYIAGFGLICCLLLYVYESNTGKSMTWAMVVVGVLCFGILILKTKKENTGVDYKTAQIIFEKVMKEEMRKEFSELPKGELVITAKGYPMTYTKEPYWIIYAFIVDLDGIEHWYVGKVRKDNGDFSGYQDCEGQKTGKEPYSEGKYR